MPQVVFNWLTAIDITPAEVGKSFFDLIRRCTPSDLPTVCGITEPPRIPFSDVEQVCAAWPHHMYWKSKTDQVNGDVGHGKFWHSVVRHCYEFRPPVHADPLALLIDASRTFGVDYSCVHVIHDSDLLREDDMLRGLVSKDLQSALPTVPWAFCFGRCYLDLIGRNKIEAASFFKVEEVGPDLLCCLTVQELGDCLLPEFQRRRNEIKREIGSEYFFDPNDPKKRATTPEFKFLRTRSKAQ